MNKIKHFFRKLISDARFAVVFSIVLAFIFWLVVTLDQNPIRQTTFSNIPVKLNIENSVPGGMSLDIISQDYQKYVSVTVEGPNYIVSSLKSSDIRVVADLSEVTSPGKKIVPLIAQRSNGASGYSIVDISPSSIELDFDYFDSREYSVLTNADGIVADSDLGLVRGEPYVSSEGDSSIVVRGTKSDLDLIDSVVALVNAKEKLDASKSYDADIVLYGIDGNRLETSKFTLSAAKVKVTVPIYKEKTLPINPVFANEPFANFGKSIIENLSVSYVTVRGPASLIEPLERIDLAKIDFSKISTANNSFDAALSLPDGIEVEGDVSHVTVKLNLNNYVTKPFTVPKSQISFKNLGGNLTASVNTDLRNVVMCGSAFLIAQATPEDFYADIDLSGKTAGAYEIPVIVRCRGRVGIWPVGTYTLTVTIK